MKRKITFGKNNPPAFLRTLLFIGCIAFSGAPAIAQDVSSNTVTGVVRFSEDNEPAPGVNIYVKGAPDKGTYSDGKGRFNFPHPLKSGDVLVFSFIGRESAEYVVLDQNTNAIEIIMLPDPIQMVEDVLVDERAVEHARRDQ